MITDAYINQKLKENYNKPALTIAPSLPTPVMFLCASWPCLLTFWPQNKWVSRIRGHGESYVWWS